MQASNSKKNKALNLRLVLSQVATRSPVSRADIAKTTGLTKQTVTNMVDELLAAELVTELGIKKEGTVGKPSKMLALASDGAFSIGIRIHRHACEIAIYTLTNQQSGFIRFEREQHLLASLQDQVSTLLQSVGAETDSIIGAGLCFVDQQDKHYPDQISKQTFIQELAETLKLPIIQETTAAACAASHMLYGEARDINSFVYIHLGAQVESAVVYGRNILLGQNGMTGAIGEVFVTPETNESDGELERLNDYASLTALAKIIGKRSDSPQALQQVNQQQPKVVQQWLENAAEPMRIAIHMLESTLNTQAIIMGGDVTPDILEQFIAKLRPLIPSIAQFGQRDVPRIIKTPRVDEIAISGVCTLPLYAALDREQPKSLFLPQLTAGNQKQRLLYQFQ